MADNTFEYTYTDVNGIQTNILLSANKAAVGGFATGAAGQGNFGKLSRKNYPWTVYGANTTGGVTKRVRIPFPSITAWQGFVQNNASFAYTGRDGNTLTYNVTSWEGEKRVRNQFAP